MISCRLVEDVEPEERRISEVLLVDDVVYCDVMPLMFQPPVHVKLPMRSYRNANPELGCLSVPPSMVLVMLVEH